MSALQTLRTIAWPLITPKICRPHNPTNLRAAPSHPPFFSHSFPVFQPVPTLCLHMLDGHRPCVISKSRLLLCRPDPPIVRVQVSDVYPSLDAVTTETYRRMQKAGRMLINHNPLPDHGLPRFFRLAFVQPVVGANRCAGIVHAWYLGAVRVLLPGLFSSV